MVTVKLEVNSYSVTEAMKTDVPRLLDRLVEREEGSKQVTRYPVVKSIAVQ